MVKRISVEDFKRHVEKKYCHKITESYALTPTEIKDVFTPFVEDKNEFWKLSDDDLLEFYQKWYDTNYEKIVAKEKEQQGDLELPEIILD